MSRIFTPLFQAATFARGAHLLLGWVFTGVVLMIYPGTDERRLADVLAVSVPLDAALLALAALVPAMRRAEGAQARLLLMPGREQDITAEPSRSWADRRRTAVWLIGRVALGSAVGMAGVVLVDVSSAVLLDPRPKPFGYQFDAFSAELQLWCRLASPLLLFGYGWLVVWAGRLQLAMAVRLLGPSPADRLAEAELRAERLLERNLLARELHDSIGHALTVTVIQAGAAREVGDPAFVAKALEVIEETGRLAMDDLERTLVLLRETPDGAAVERPGIEQLPGLFDTARAAGSPVEERIDLPADRLPAGRLPGVLSRESYRIVQEAVTNALKYAPGEPIGIRIRVRDGQLELRCANAAAVRSGAETVPRKGGKGLRGIRERAVLLGGEATAGTESGEWVLAVRIPLRLGA